MKLVLDILEDRITSAMDEVAGESGSRALVRVAAGPKFGDYQANGVMALAKKLKQNPRDLAGQVVAKLRIDDICEQPEVAGPGFINLRLTDAFLQRRLLDINSDPTGRLGIDKTEKPENIVVDFSSPNIAKQMHVGHLRSTIIGDCICRMFEFAGHKVIRQNHIGDWGTQFGMLIAHLGEVFYELNPNGDLKTDLENLKKFPIQDLEGFYKEAKCKFDNNLTFADKAREMVVRLHNHEKDTDAFWQHIVDESRKHYQPIYNCLAVDLHKENECGESFYSERLAGVVAELEQSGLARESEGAVCVFPPGFANKDGSELPFIIRKSDGAFLYATTDLAAMKYRIDELGAGRIIYITDARQQLHFKMLFATAKMAGWLDDDIEISHVTFGTMMGADGRPFKTRSGENVKLADLLAEAVEQARKVVEDKNAELDEETKQEIAKAVGIGAVKYADFSNNRTTDYIFSFDRMLAMEGNTAPYMQYAYARVKSIERKGQKKDIDIAAELATVKSLNITESAESDLAKHLIRYGEGIRLACSDCRPNHLTAYLYDLAQKFSSFYNACPVLISGADKRPTRLLLCDLTARTMKHGLNELLGIGTVDQM